MGDSRLTWGVELSDRWMWMWIGCGSVDGTIRSKKDAEVGFLAWVMRDIIWEIEYVGYCHNSQYYYCVPTETCLRLVDLVLNQSTQTK